jgi:hypothetical protein
MMTVLAEWENPSHGLHLEHNGHYEIWWRIADNLDVFRYASRRLAALLFRREAGRLRDLAGGPSVPVPYGGPTQ